MQVLQRVGRIEGTDRNVLLLQGFFASIEILADGKDFQEGKGDSSKETQAQKGIRGRKKHISY